MTIWTDAPFADARQEAALLVDRIIIVLRRDPRLSRLSLADLDLLLANVRNEIEERLDVVIEQAITDNDADEED
jgi:hypothetical protein